MFLHKGTRLLDTTTSLKNYRTALPPAGKPFVSRCHMFSNTVAVKNFWTDLKCVCLNTPLGKFDILQRSLPLIPWLTEINDVQRNYLQTKSCPLYSFLQCLLIPVCYSHSFSSYYSQSSWNNCCFLAFWMPRLTLQVYWQWHSALISQKVDLEFISTLNNSVSLDP